MRSTFADNGVPSARSSYNSYGLPVEQLGDTGPFGFTGTIQDKSWNLSLMGSRWIDNGYGSFYSRDPMAGSAMTPLSMNPYEYGLDAPSMFHDSNGMAPVISCGKGQASSAGQCVRVRQDGPGGGSGDDSGGVLDGIRKVIGSATPPTVINGEDPCVPPEGFLLKLPVNSDGSLATGKHDEQNSVCIHTNPMKFSPDSPVRHQPRVIVTYDPRSGVICAVSNESEGSTEPVSTGDSGNPGRRGKKSLTQLVQIAAEVLKFPEELQKLLRQHPEWEFVDSAHGDKTIYWTPRRYPITLGVSDEIIFPGGRGLSVPGVRFTAWERNGIVPRNMRIFGNENALWEQIEMAIDSSVSINFVVDSIEPSNPEYVREIYPIIENSTTNNELDRIFINDTTGKRADKTLLWRDGAPLLGEEEEEFIRDWRKLRGS